MAVLGYDPGGTADDWGATTTAGVSNLRAYRPDPMTTNGWGYAMVCEVGRRSGQGNPTISMAVYDSGDDLFERTDSFEVSTVMEDIAGGVRVEEPLRSCIKLRNGNVYPQMILGTAAPYGHGMIAAAKISRDDEKFYFRNVATQPPPDPMGWTSSANNGWLAVATLYEPNVPPDKPDSGFEPDDGATGVSTTPTFKAFFRDDNELVPGFEVGEADVMDQYRIQIATSADSDTIIFDSNWVNANTTERDNRQFNYSYDDTPLSGTRYWRCAVRDDFGEASPYSNWLSFTVGGGAVTVPSPNPTGKQLTRTPSPFDFRWNHSGGLSTNAVKLRIKSGGTVIKESATITKTVAPNSNGSITWAESAFSQLPLGMVGSYSVQGRDTTGLWSSWGPDASFSVDAAPGVPIVSSPAGTTVNSLPEFLAYVTDADDVAASLTVTMELMNASGTVLFSRTMSHIGNNWFRYQALAGDGLVSGTSYWWTAYAFDGTFYSGGRTTSASAIRAGSEDFTYLIMTAPALVFPIGNQEINTTRPRYDWTFAGVQVKFRVVVWDLTTLDANGNYDTVYDSGIIVQSGETHQQPSTSDSLPDDHRLRWKVTIWDNLGNIVESQPADFDVELDEAPTLAASIGVHTVAQDDVGTAVKISWSQSTHEGFSQYIIRRWPDEDTILDIDDPFGRKHHRIAEISDVESTNFIDHPSFGVTWFYSVRQEVTTPAGDTVSSPATVLEIQIDFDGVVICDVAHCADKRAVLRGRETRTIPRIKPRKYVAAWGDEKPTAFDTDYFAREPEATYVFYSENPAVIENGLKDLDRMFKDGGPLLYRDGRSKLMLGEMDEYREIDPPGGMLRRAFIRFKQTAAQFVFDT
jgi:hypothetical protein